MNISGLYKNIYTSEPILFPNLGKTSLEFVFKGEFGPIVKSKSKTELEEISS